MDPLHVCHCCTRVELSIKKPSKRNQFVEKHSNLSKHKPCQHCTLVGHRTYDFNSCHVLLACSQMQGLLPQRRIGCADSRNLESLIASLHSWAKISSFEAMPGSTQQRFPLQRLCSFSGFWQLHPFCAQCTLLVSLKSVAV